MNAPQKPTEAQAFFNEIDAVSGQSVHTGAAAPETGLDGLSNAGRAIAPDSRIFVEGEYLPRGSAEDHLKANLSELGLWSRAVYYMAAQGAKREAAVAIARDLINAGREVAFQKIALATDLEKNRTVLAYFEAKPALAAKLHQVTTQANATLARCLYQSRDLVYGERSRRAMHLAKQKARGFYADADYQREVELVNELTQKQLDRAYGVLRDVYEQFEAHLTVTLRVLAEEAPLRRA